MLKVLILAIALGADLAHASIIARLDQTSQTGSPGQPLNHGPDLAERHRLHRVVAAASEVLVTGFVD